MILQQLIDTEARYVQGLGLLSDGFQGMLRKERARLEQQSKLRTLGMQHLSEERITTIFGNISQIEHIHQELYAALRERQDGQWLSMGVGDLFGNLLVPRLQLYQRYSSRFAAALAALRQARGDPLFNRVLHTLQGKLGLGWPTLEDLLELPFGRMRYYATALQELLLVSRLDIDTEEFYSLSQAACAMQDTEATMRADRQETGRGMRVDGLRRLLPRSRLPSTKLVKEGWLVNHAEPGVVWYFILFQNAIVGLRRDPRGFEAAKTVLLDDVSVDESLGSFSTGAFVAGDETSTRMIGSANAFIVSDGAVTLELVAGSRLEKDQWVRAINECIN